MEHARYDTDKGKLLKEKPIPVSLLLPQIPQELAWEKKHGSPL
jgi:hypothetical protein